MSPPTDPKSDLQKAIRKGGAIIVAGTGVSIAASNGHPQASWTGLLKSGLALLRKHNLIPEEDSAAHLQLLGGAPEIVQFIATAQAITREMSPRKLHEWLKETIGSIRAGNRELLDALEAIRQYGNLLATTNYDGLLLESNADLSRITWRDKAAFLRAYRERETKHVFFLHGYWDAPESVILDERSYQEITRDQNYRDDLNAIWRTSTWIYVGCGENGLSDPDIGLLLDLYGKRARDDGHWDFCLVRRAEKDRLQRYFNEKGHNICAVPFGDEHADLPDYLWSLLPPPVTPVDPVVESVTPPVTPPTPQPPELHAEPNYIGSHPFVGREAELQTLNSWAAPDDSTSILVFEAIGGNGKSMLTWEWTKNHAPGARPGDKPWAGRFWYSFNERGATMAHFCQRALAYMTRRPPDHYAKKKTAELKGELVAQLRARPWLLVLDGLERVLVAYHRIDAPGVPDEEADAPTDKIADRNPCDAIRDEDDDLLFALAAAGPSKLLVSSRLTPRALLNDSGQSVNGVKRVTLRGLRPPDAERLLRSCGVREDSPDGITGESAAIRSYLTANCDNHPLVIGILGGLIVNYLPARGNFDRWSTDFEGGALLDLASLDLVHRRDHILRAALDALPAEGRQLLSILALIADPVDYETLKAFNPHLPPEPGKVEKPEPPTSLTMSSQNQYDADLRKWEEYEMDVCAWRGLVRFLPASQKLEATVIDLEQRGLLKSDQLSRPGGTYFLHPVVRGVASGMLSKDDLEIYGQLIVNYSSEKADWPFELAQTLEDLRDILLLVRILLRLGRLEEAAIIYTGISEESTNITSLAKTLTELEAHAETLSILKPYFYLGWGKITTDIPLASQMIMMHHAGRAFQSFGESDLALTLYSLTFFTWLRSVSLEDSFGFMSRINNLLLVQNRIAAAWRLSSLGYEGATFSENKVAIAENHFNLINVRSTMGLWENANEFWKLYYPSDNKTDRKKILTCEDLLVLRFIESRIWKGSLRNDLISEAERFSVDSEDSNFRRSLNRLLGGWRLDQGDWASAEGSYQEAVRLARERSLLDADAETGLALAKFHISQSAGSPQPDRLPEFLREARRLGQLRNPAHRRLSQLWLALGDREQAKRHALDAHRWAWADGEPYVHRYELNRTIELLQRMDVAIPTLPPYDPAKDKPFHWEPLARTAIEKLRAEWEIRRTERED